LKKVIVFIVVSAFIMTALFSLATVAFAGKPNGPAAYNGLNRGSSDMQHLELYAKDADWAPIVNGPSGKLTFNSDRFVFNGHKLQPNTDYTLIVYDQIDDGEAWPGTGPALASGTSSNGGNLNLRNVFVSTVLDDAKIWLVPTSDVNQAGELTSWNPANYLFEYARVSN